jgi:hypothetical protein
MFRVLSAPDETTVPATPAPVPAGGSNPLTGATETTLPGLATFKGLVLGLIPYALVACVAAFLIGAILWAMGAFGHNPQHSSRGKTTLIVALVAALLVGGAAYLVGWFNNVGKTVSAPVSVTQLVEPANPSDLV